MKLIAICGMPGSGKTTVNKIIESKGYASIRLGVTQMVLEKYGEVTEELEKNERTQIREELGMGAFAKISIPKIKKLFEEGRNIVIENMYSWSEYKEFKAAFPQEFVTIAVHAHPTLRYKRLAERTDDPRDLSDAEIAKSRDYSEIEQLEKGGPIAMADHNILNEGTEEELREKVEVVFNEINNPS